MVIEVESDSEEWTSSYNSNDDQFVGQRRSKPSLIITSDTPSSGSNDPPGSYRAGLV
jgi:hypothetical protein